MTNTKFFTILTLLSHEKKNNIFTLNNLTLIIIQTQQSIIRRFSQVKTTDNRLNPQDYHLLASHPQAQLTQPVSDF